MRTIIVLSAVFQMFQALAVVQDGSSAEWDDIHPAYDTLDTEQRDLYDSIVGPIANADAWIPCPGADLEKLFIVLNAVTSDHPEYWWQDKYRYYLDIDGAGIRLPSSQPSPEQCIQGYHDLVKIVSGIRFSGSDGDRVRDAHNWLVKHVRYDTMSDECGNQYGAIVCGLAKCDGYAYAMNLLCRQAGVESLYTEGQIEPYRSYHAWNINKVDGRWYYTDVTWDDQMGFDPVHNYRYLLLGSDRLPDRHPDYTYGLDISHGSCPYRPYTMTENIIFFGIWALIGALQIGWCIKRYYENKKFTAIYLEKRQLAEQEKSD